LEREKWRRDRRSVARGENVSVALSAIRVAIDRPDYQS